MRLTSTFINSRIELFDGSYGVDRERQLTALRRIYNRTIGPVNAINMYYPELQDLSIYSSSCEHVPFGLLMRDLTVKAGVTDTVHVPGGGKGDTLQQAFLGGLGEAAERLLGILHFGRAIDHLVLATYEQLVRQGRKALGPQDIPLFAEEQYQSTGFSYERFHERTPLAWVEGTGLVDGEKVLVPAQLMLIYYKHASGEAHIGYPTTGGLAFHCGRRQAILHGLYEYVERDAINLRWYCQLAPPRVDVNLQDFLVDRSGPRRSRMATPAFEDVAVYLNTIDVPLPVFSTIAIDRSRRERAFLGGGGAWSRKERALTQALFELGQSRTALKFYAPSGLKNIQANSSLEEMSDFFDAAVFFGYADNLRRLSWYMADEHQVAWRDVPSFDFANDDEEYAAMLSLMRSRGLEPVIFDFDAACWPGMTVSKVFIPQLTQACIPSTPLLGHPRFYDIPRMVGLSDHRLNFGDLNSDPVPFP